MSWPPSERILSRASSTASPRSSTPWARRRGLADPTPPAASSARRCAAPGQLPAGAQQLRHLRARHHRPLHGAGVAPYGDTDAAVLMANHLAPEPVPIHPLVEDSPLRDVLARATDKRTTHRYRSALEMLDELEPVVRKLSAATPDRDDIARLEELFPKDERVHWKLRRQDAMRETMPCPVAAHHPGEQRARRSRADPTEDRFPSGEAERAEPEREPGAPGSPHRRGDGLPGAHHSVHLRQRAQPPRARRGDRVRPRRAPRARRHFRRRRRHAT